MAITVVEFKKGMKEKDFTVPQIKSVLDTQKVKYGSKDKKSDLFKAMVKALRKRQRELEKKKVAAKKVSKKKEPAKTKKKKRKKKSKRTLAHAASKKTTKRKNIQKRWLGDKKAVTEDFEQWQSKNQKALTEIKDENMYQQGAVLILKIRKWGAAAGLPKELLGPDVPKKIVRGVQKLLADHKVLDEIKSVRSIVNKILRFYSVDHPIPGFRFVLGDNIPKVDDLLKEVKERYYLLVQRLVDTYEDDVQAYATQYPTWYQASRHKYPTKQELGKRFELSWRWALLKPPSEEMSFISPELIKQEQEKFREEIREIKSIAMDAARAKILKRIQKIQKQCIDDTVHQKTLNGLDQMLARWDSMWSGFVGNREFRKTIDEVKAHAKKLSADRLRDNETFRKETQKEFGKLAERLEVASVMRPKKRKRRLVAA